MLLNLIEVITMGVYRFPLSIYDYVKLVYEWWKIAFYKL